MTWEAPTTFPDLGAASTIAIDVETCDPHLKARGPGGVRGDGFLVGVAVATDQWSGYYPIAHEDGGNLDRKAVLRWLSDQLGRTSQAKVGANILYDLEWLRASGVTVNGRLFDCLGAEALLDEHRLSYSLDSVAGDRLGKHKDESLLKTIVASKFGKKANPKECLWRLHPRYVGGYAEEDARLALELLAVQMPLLEQEGLSKVFMLESDILPMLLDMRFKGIRVDLDRAEQLKKELRGVEETAQIQLDDLAGFHVEIWAAESVAKAFRKFSLPFPMTERKEGSTSTKPFIPKPSFTRLFLEGHPHPIAKHVVEVRRINKLCGNFVQKQVLEGSVRGRVHCLFHSLRSDAGGTVSGRFSCSQPNLQQVPSRDKLAPLIRSMFLPEDGSQLGDWDYSQIEQRVTIHYAVRQGYRGSTKAQAYYLNDPSADYHKMVARMIDPNFDSLADYAAKSAREIAKTTNFGLIFGMGKKKLAASLNMSYEEASSFLDTFHAGVPFVRALMEATSRAAESRGFLKTLMGRVARFPDWERARLEKDEKWEPPLPLKYAQGQWPGRQLRRSGLHKAINRLIQGSAADILKKAMLAVYKAGHTPHLTVHDELVGSVPMGEDGSKVLDEIKNIMQDCVKLEVPLLVNAGLGPNWGEAKH